ncbi:hypothetical protein GGR52DRAFT_574093 [Hypoxylon sp. FL1284]|nr:hypothetical protein GGR52DRAFT_574093 [Hypoxylon sp. FL1284]
MLLVPQVDTDLTQTYHIVAPFYLVADIITPIPVVCISSHATTDHCSRLTAHGSRLTARGSWFMPSPAQHRGYAFAGVLLYLDRCLPRPKVKTAATDQYQKDSAPHGILLANPHNTLLPLDPVDLFAPFASFKPDPPSVSVWRPNSLAAWATCLVRRAIAGTATAYAPSPFCAKVSHDAASETYPNVTNIIVYAERRIRLADIIRTARQNPRHRLRDLVLRPNQSDRFSPLFMPAACQANMMRRTGRRVKRSRARP